MISKDIQENKKNLKKIFHNTSDLILYEFNTLCEDKALIGYVVVTQAALGIEQARHTNLPFLVYTRLIDNNVMIQRIDPLYIIVWLSASAGRIITYGYFSYKVFKDIFNMKKGKPILYISGILIGLVSLYLNSIGVGLTPNSIMVNIHIYMNITFVVIIPLFITIVYFFRRKILDQNGT